MRESLPKARVARKKTYSVRILQAPRANDRRLAALITASGGTPPKKSKPTQLGTFQVVANSLHKASRLVAEHLRKKNLDVRSVNRGLREFIVYIAHPDDRKQHVAPHPTP